MELERRMSKTFGVLRLRQGLRRRVFGSAACRLMLRTVEICTHCRRKVPLDPLHPPLYARRRPRCGHVWARTRAATWSGRMCMYIYVYIHVYIHIYFLCLYLPIYLSIYRPIDLSTYRSIDLSTYRSIDLSIYLSVFVCVCVDEDEDVSRKTWKNDSKQYKQERQWR